MAKNYLLIYSEQLATDIELFCQTIKFQIRKCSSSVYANIREANYGQSKADIFFVFTYIYAPFARFFARKTSSEQDEVFQL